MKRIAVLYLGFILLSGLTFALSAQEKSDSKDKESGEVRISEQALQKRLQGLEQGRANTLATLQAYDGAIQECKYWIAQLEASESTEKEKKETKPKAEKEPKAKSEAKSEKK